MRVQNFGAPNTELLYLNDSLLAITCKVTEFLSFSTIVPPTTGCGCMGKNTLRADIARQYFATGEDDSGSARTMALYKQNLSSPYYSAYDLTERWPDLRNCDIQGRLCRGTTSCLSELRNNGGLLVLERSDPLEKGGGSILVNTDRPPSTISSRSAPTPCGSAHPAQDLLVQYLQLPSRACGSPSGNGVDQ
ncbi:hypothetical protein ACQ86N_16645 [Puia sp. P3]|uniref:hypothetical protein n=1 Tax=Puia sp. P3 TaxID=3423952 RepID=UPI003D67A206